MEPPRSSLRQLRAIGPLPGVVAFAVPLALCLAWGTNLGWGLPAPLAAASVGAGLGLAFLGLRLMHSTITLFAREGEGTLAPWDPTRRLVVTGPYHRVRNPMITGVFTLLCGEALATGSPAIAVWTAAFGTVNAIYMPLAEEPGLVKRFGEDYLDYKRNVPRWIPRLTPWLPALVVVAALALMAAPAGASTISSDRVESSPADARGYWTPERMREATPLEGPAFPDQVEPAPAPADSGASAAAGPTLFADPSDEEISPSLDTLYPERIHGRLFFKIGPSDASCSATVVTSHNRNVILTAGHCLVTPTPSEPLWSTNVIFVPAYYDGATPFGTYAGTVLRAPSLWSFEGFPEFDVGTVNLTAGPGGQIEDVLGSRGISFNRPGDRYKKNKTEFQIFGYPGEPSAFYDAERPILCRSKFKGFELFTDSPKAGPCNMKEGSSGGGYVLSGGILNSVVSHTACGTDPNCTLIAGTYLGDTAFSLWKQAGGGISKGRKKKLNACKRKPKQGGKKANCIWEAQQFEPTRR